MANLPKVAVCALSLAKARPNQYFPHYREVYLYHAWPWSHEHGLLRPDIPLTDQTATIAGNEHEAP